MNIVLILFYPPNFSVPPPPRVCTIENADLTELCLEQIGFPSSSLRTGQEGRPDQGCWAAVFGTWQIPT